MPNIQKNLDSIDEYLLNMQNKVNECDVNGVISNVIGVFVKKEKYKKDYKFSGEETKSQREQFDEFGNKFSKLVKEFENNCVCIKK